MFKLKHIRICFSSPIDLSLDLRSAHEIMNSFPIADISFALTLPGVDDQEVNFYLCFLCCARSVPRFDGRRRKNIYGSAFVVFYNFPLNFYVLWFNDSTNIAHKNTIHKNLISNVHLFARFILFCSHNSLFLLFAFIEISFE